MVNVVVSVLNFRGKKNTSECIASLKKIDTSGFKLTVLVIDNKSEEELDINDFSFEGIIFKVIKNKENLGFSGGHNIGIKYAIENKADFFVLLNNDTYVDKDFIKNMLEIALKDNEIGILVPKIYFAPGFEFHKERYKKEELGKVIWYAGGEMDWNNVIGKHRGVDDVDSGKYEKIEETEFATGCCMMIRRQVFDKVGMLDTKYFLYYEDNDFCMRTRRERFKIMYVPASLVFHKNAASSGSGSSLQDYFITRNRMLFGMRYAKARAKLALFKESMSFLLKGRYWQKRGILDFYLGKLNKGSFKI